MNSLGLAAEKVDVGAQNLYGLVEENVVVGGFALGGCDGRWQAGRGSVLERDLVGRGLESGMGQLFMFAFVLTGHDLRQLLPALGFIERNRFLGHALLEPSDIRRQIAELLFRVEAMTGSFPQGAEIGLHLIQLFVGHGGQSVPRQRVLQGRLVHIAEVTRRRQNDVGRDTSQLRRVAIRSIELANRDLERARVVRVREVGLVHHGRERQKVLHRAFAEGRGIANDQGTPVVLQSTDQDFRRRSAKSAGQQDQWPIVLNGGIRIQAYFNLAFEATCLHHRALANEQSRQADRLFQRPAAVASQIQDHAAHVLLLQLGQQTRYIRGRAARFATLSLAHVDIEGWQVDDPESEDVPLLRRQIQNTGLRLLFFEPDLVAYERHGLRKRAVGSACGNDGQFYRRPFLAAHQLHGTWEGYVPDVNRLPAGLRDGHDAIARFELTASERGPTRQELVNLVAAIPCLHGYTDADKREVHADG